MAATAAVGSCFSAAVVTPCIQSKHAPSDVALKIAGLRASRAPNVAHYGEHLSIGRAASRKWRLPRISSAVDQGEVTAAVEEAEPDEKEKEQEEGEEGEEGEEEEEEQKEEEKGGEVMADTPVSTKLYFGNLPYNCDSSHLAGIIQEYASPEMVEVLYDRDTGRSRGFAFVTMSSTDDCEAIIQNLDGSQYGGRTLRVNYSDKPKPKEPLYPETEHKLFVGNLSWSVTSESLTQVFQEYGNVVGARVLFDGDTGQSRGYGFVCYSTKSEMETALESLNGVELEGRAMRISLALGKRS